MKRSTLFTLLSAVLLVALIFLSILAVNPTVAQTDPTPTSEPVEDDHIDDDHVDDDHADEGEHVAPEVIEQGYELFVANGCIACHGTNGEGTDIAPALAGHTREDVYRQLRSPIGIMTPFSPEQISIRDAEFIFAYIQNLPMAEMDMDMGGEQMHGHGSFRINQVVEYHHWYALAAIQEGNTGEALHHLSHIVEFTEGPHQVAMQNILEDVIDGNLEEAQAKVEDMLFGLMPPETPQPENYVRFGLVMLTLDRPFHAVDYLEHSGEMFPLDAPIQEELDEIIALIEFEDIEAAEEQLNDLIATFTPVDSDMGDMDMHDDDADHMDDSDDNTDMHDDDVDHMDDGDDDMDMHDDDADHMDDSDDNMDMSDDHDADMDMATGFTTIDDLVTALEDAGATVSLAETLDQPFFDVPAQIVMVNEAQALQVFEYSDEMGALDAMNSVDPSGSPIGTSQVSWMMPPHFYHNGHLIVIYIGVDSDTLSLLEDVLGEQFAGQ